MDERIGPASGLIRLAFLVESVYAEVGHRCELTPTQAQMLCLLRGGPKGMAELCRVLGVERSSLTGLVDRAERSGLVERLPDPDDRRAVRVALTGAGDAAACRFHDEVTDRLRALLADLPETERARFTRTVARIVAGAGVPALFAEPTPA
jgi:DNA-binding MarR family transcriptional regulator